MIHTFFFELGLYKPSCHLKRTFGLHECYLLMAGMSGVGKNAVWLCVCGRWKGKRVWGLVVWALYIYHHSLCVFGCWRKFVELRGEGRRTPKITNKIGEFLWSVVNLVDMVSFKSMVNSPAVVNKIEIHQNTVIRNRYWINVIYYQL